MPRHMLQPGSRQSKPAALKTSSRPSRSACFLTSCEPGTTMARTVVATWWPRTTCGGGAEIFDAGVGAGAEKDGVELDVFDLCAGFEVHVLERAGEALAVGLGEGVVGGGNVATRWR